MSLDLPKISGTLANAMSTYTLDKVSQANNLKSIIEFANNVDSKTAIESTRYSNVRPYLKAEVIDQIIGAYAVSNTPKSWNVLSTDGSHIDIDRHLPIPCSLINTGTCYISYGEDPEAKLSNEPSLKLHQAKVLLLQIKRSLHKEDHLKISGMAVQKRTIQKKLFQLQPN